MSSPAEKHLGEALRDLVADQPFTPDAAAIESRARRDRRRRIVRGGIGAGAVAIAAVTAVGVAAVVPSGSARAPQAAPVAHPATRASAAHPARAALPHSSTNPTHASGAADAPHTLVQLADVLAAAPQPKGDATLIERETSYPGHASINVWDLYGDNGEYFFSKTRSGLPAQVSENNSQGGSLFAQEVAAATYAETGNLDTAALKMAWAGSTGPVPAWLSNQLKDISKGGLQIDNYVWENSEDALVTGAGNPKVDAGVLRLVSILPGITVTHGSYEGQPTVTITAGEDEVGTLGGGPKTAGDTPYQEAMTIYTDSGMPLRMVGGTADTAEVTVSYVPTRVSLADVEAGKF